MPTTFRGKSKNKLLSFGEKRRHLKPHPRQNTRRVITLKKSSEVMKRFVIMADIIQSKRQQNNSRYILGNIFDLRLQVVNLIKNSAEAAYKIMLTLKVKTQGFVDRVRLPTRGFGDINEPGKRNCFTPKSFKEKST